MVSGYMPLSHAQYLYENYKDLNIRVAGHCGNPPPEEWASCKDGYAKAKPIVDKFLTHEISKEECDSQCLVIMKSGDQFIDRYHIDSQLGLCKFAETILENSIIA